MGMYLVQELLRTCICAFWILNIARERQLKKNVVTVINPYNGYLSIITDMIRIYNGYKKVDRVYQVELEILYFMLPSLLNNSENSLQEPSGQVLYLTACKVSNSTGYTRPEYIL
jgi:hypothetical protein